MCYQTLIYVNWKRSLVGWWLRIFVSHVFFNPLFLRWFCKAALESSRKSFLQMNNPLTRSSQLSFHKFRMATKAQCMTYALDTRTWKKFRVCSILASSKSLTKMVILSSVVASECFHELVFLCSSYYVWLRINSYSQFLFYHRRLTHPQN